MYGRPAARGRYRRGRRTPTDAAAKRFDHLASPIWIPLGFEECSQYVGGELLLPGT